MHLVPHEAHALARELLPGLSPLQHVEVVLCPPFLDLTTVADAVRGSSVRVGAQNAYYHDKGAYTGEVSAAMLKDIVSHVILGHSERRTYFGETDELVNRKLHAAIAHGLVPIVCVGEHLGDYEGGRTANVVRIQIRQSLADLTAETLARVVVAYEPIWAIGTGRAATPGIAQETAAYIRGELAALYGRDAADRVRIQYGGSVTATNCQAYFEQPDVDGALVGGASLKADDFIAIARRCEEARAAHSS